MREEDGRGSVRIVCSPTGAKKQNINGSCALRLSHVFDFDANAPDSAFRLVQDTVSLPALMCRTPKPRLLMQSQPLRFGRP